MAVEHDLSKETAAARALLLSCKDALSDDEQAQADAIEGQTGLHEAIQAAVARVSEIEALQAGLTEHVTALKARAERFGMQADRIRAAIVSAMAETGLRKLELPMATLSLRAASHKLGAVNEADIPARFFVEQPPKLDRKALLDALKADEPVPGATLSNGAPSLTIRVK